jgi:hypothetical protein
MRCSLSFRSGLSQNACMQRVIAVHTCVQCWLYMISSLRCEALGTGFRLSGETTGTASDT